MNTVFKMPGGRAIPMRRAIRMGLADAEGNALAPAPDSRGAALIRKDERKAEWTRKQRIRTGATEVVAPEVTADGQPVVRRGRKKVEPLKPQNVDAEGVAITDEELLAEIAAKTAAIEASMGEEDALDIESGMFHKGTMTDEEQEAAGFVPGSASPLDDINAAVDAAEAES